MCVTGKQAQSIEGLEMREAFQQLKASKTNTMLVVCFTVQMGGLIHRWWCHSKNTTFLNCYFGEALRAPCC